MKENIRAYIEQGKVYYQNQQYKKAETCFQEVIDAKKDFADVHNYMGLILHQKQLFGDAIKSFEKALKINPRYTEALLNLSILYNDMGEYDKAKKLVLQSKKDASKTKAVMDPFIRSKLANKHAEVGDWYRGVGAFAQAVEEYQKALHLEEKYVDIRTKMAICLREIGQKDKCLVELKRVLKDNPKFADAHIQLGITHYAHHKKEEAVKVWKTAAKTFPTNKTLKMYLRFTEQKS